MTVSFRLNPPGIKQVLSQPGNAVWTDIQRRGNRVLNAARVNAPVDEGRLRGSLKMEMRVERGEPVARVGTNVEYAIYVHEGTGVYAGRGPIKPVRAKVLRWPIKNNSGRTRRRYRGGKTSAYAFAKQVKGVKGRPFLRNALRAAGGTTTTS